MPKFQDHITQANKNLAFLEIINHTAPEHHDWQVTTCFYTALHLVNAHLAHFDMQYRSHTDVKYAINPHNSTSIMRLPEDIYVAYESLFSHSRRSRYLINNKDDKLHTDIMAFTGSKHLAKVIRHLDTICIYFAQLYNLDIPITSIKCNQITDRGDFTFFKIEK